MKNAVNLGSYIDFDGTILGKYIDLMIARADGLMGSALIWVKVEAVAAALIEHKHLSAESDRQICRDAVMSEARIRQLQDEQIAGEQAESDALMGQIEAGAI